MFQILLFISAVCAQDYKKWSLLQDTHKVRSEVVLQNVRLVNMVANITSTVLTVSADKESEVLTEFQKIQASLELLLNHQKLQAQKKVKYSPDDYVTLGIENDGFRKEMKSYKTACESLEHMQHDLLNFQEVVKSNEDLQENLQNHITELTNTNADLKQNVSLVSNNLDKETHQMDDMTATNAALVKKRDELIAKVNSLTGEYSDVQKKVDLDQQIIASKTKDMNDEHAKIVELMKLQNELQATVLTLKAQTEELAKARDLLAAQVSTLSSQRSSLEATDTSLEKDKKSLQGKKDELVSTNTNLVQFRDNLNAQVADLRSKNNALTVQTVSMGNKLSALAKENDAMKQKDEDLVATNKKLVDKNNQLTSSLAKIQNLLGSLGLTGGPSTPSGTTLLAVRELIRNSDQPEAANWFSWWYILIPVLFCIYILQNRRQKEYTRISGHPEVKVF